MKLKSILATDCGSTTTKAILIEFIDGESSKNKSTVSNQPVSNQPVSNQHPPPISFDELQRQQNQVSKKEPISVDTKIEQQRARLAHFQAEETQFEGLVGMIEAKLAQTQHNQTSEIVLTSQSSELLKKERELHTERARLKQLSTSLQAEVDQQQNSMRLQQAEIQKQADHHQHLAHQLEQNQLNLEHQQNALQTQQIDFDLKKHQYESQQRLFELKLKSLEKYKALH